MRLIEPSFEILSIPDGEEALALIERIGREAYQSTSRIDPGGDGREPSSHRFVRRLLKQGRRQQLYAVAERMLSDSIESPAKAIVDTVYDELSLNPPHLSVIEHCSATVLFVTNRGVTHELVRHRLCSVTQESTRYCDYNKQDGGLKVTPRTDEDLNGFLDDWYVALETAEQAYLSLVRKGVKPQIARDVSTNAQKASIAITANFRQWRHVFRMRCSKLAHPDMRSLMLGVRNEFRRRIPIIFDEDLL